VRLRKDAKTELLRRTPLFANCSKRELDAIGGIADEIDLKEGKELTREGKPGREFFVLVEGTADVVKKGRRVNTLEAMDFFGEIALIHESPRTATVKATSPLRAMGLTSWSMRSLIKEHPEIAQHVIEVLVARLRATDARFND